MGDAILEVGGAGIEGADAKVKALMNNVVNSETPGYRKSDVIIKSFPAYLDAAQKKSNMSVPQVDGMYFDQQAGPLLRTGNKTDLAIGGDGFFVVDMPDGKGYTRDGRFAINPNGRLVTVAGNYPVEGLSGPINIQPGAKIEFTTDGHVLSQGAEINTIKIVNFDDKTALKPVTGSIFRAPDTARTEINPSPAVVDGYVEASNVNEIEETMNLISFNRNYAVDRKIVSNRDTMLLGLLSSAWVQ